MPDVGPIVCQLLGTEGASGHVWNFAGSGTATQLELVTKIYAMAGSPLRMMVGGKKMLRLLGLFNPMMREMVEMHYLQTDPVLLNDSRLEKLLGRLKRTLYDQGIRLTLDAMENVKISQCEPFGIPSMSPWTGPEIIVPFPRTKTASRGI